MLLVRGRKFRSVCYLQTLLEYILMNIVNTLFVVVLICALAWLARDFIKRQYWELKWNYTTGYDWNDQDGENEVRDRALTKMARTGDRDRFERARALALKLDAGHPWHGRQSQILDFDHYAKL